ncbi:MAG: type II toxin-antitoxin system RelE/ParE family toxin [candidate division NC10 bacterium]|nr:type II toxin-antitoxin system RelE/ParE family toxin [candidate division NC10 bacterium]
MSLPDEDKAKVISLFNRLADFGRISNREKFNQLGEKAGPRGRGIWEFKSFQIRFFGEFRAGAKFVIAHGTSTKKSRALSASDIGIAIRILAEHDARRSESK